MSTLRLAKQVFKPSRTRARVVVFLSTFTSVFLRLREWYAAPVVRPYFVLRPITIGSRTRKWSDARPKMVSVFSGRAIRPRSKRARLNVLNATFAVGFRKTKVPSLRTFDDTYLVVFR